MLLTRLLLAALILCCVACSRSPYESPRDFTREFADAFRRSDPTMSVEIVRDLEIKITRPGAAESSTSFLDNAYDAYNQAPAAKAEIIRQYVGVVPDLKTADHGPVDRTRIVPIVKDRPWLDEMRKAAGDLSKGKPFDQVFEDLSPDLIILYAEDTDKTIRYVSPTDLKKIGLDRAELRQLAIDNLRRLLPPVQRRGDKGLFILTAGGVYESSLLLFDKLWANLQTEVDGDIVLAIPNRDLLIVTGSHNSEGVQKLRTMAAKSHTEGTYRLTPKLFTRKQGKIEEFK